MSNILAFRMPGKKLYKKDEIMIQDLGLNTQSDNTSNLAESGEATKKVDVATKDGEAVDKSAFKVQMKDVPYQVLDWIRNNPGTAGLYAANGAIIICPALITGPTLGLLGFSAAGPAGGTAAAWIQSVIGPVAARGIFATLQSAAMGGYGAAVVNGTASAAGGSVMVWNAVRRLQAIKLKSGPKDESVESVETGDEKAESKGE
ncbi:MAG: hypothetical protein M1821_003077 [Bathelium mastoideum]|nr:MAG: hypothetical protein M1821_003077 [Bathelium mastoideum]